MGFSYVQRNIVYVFIIWKELYFVNYLFQKFIIRHILLYNRSPHCYFAEKKIKKIKNKKTYLKFIIFSIPGFEIINFVVWELISESKI